jgi:hypothetical protein
MIISWGIWLSRNKSIFQDVVLEPSIITTKAIGILSHFPRENDGVAIWHIQVEEVDKSYPWGYFDGVAQGDLMSCIGGGVLYLFDSHFFHLKSSLGEEQTFLHN